MGAWPRAELHLRSAETRRQLDSVLVCDLSRFAFCTERSRC